jgi:hypothetical protein
MKKTFLLLFLLQCCYSHAQQEISNNHLINHSFSFFVDSLKLKNIIKVNDTIFFENEKYSRRSCGIIIVGEENTYSFLNFKVDGICFKAIGLYFYPSNTSYLKEFESNFILNCHQTNKDSNLTEIHYYLQQITGYKTSYFTKKFKAWTGEIIFHQRFRYEYDSIAKGYFLLN